ncbi:hypothetical protein VHEMI09103 [[Torrubiella] hemipterigena]|uniref:C2H2-type domain-containing protein n=1 Tax=[Torrubiella] hemipterigena TaxID=1531966 RepID=A0A0A1TQW2_9HYPO|nr:hypothetical protein VHEMI09103 [[Torrubiella] hemipterigena]
MWATTSGVFRNGQQSLVTRLKSSLEMSVLHQQLLLSLEACLSRVKLHENEEDEMSIDSESDRSSNRSEASYRLALDDQPEDEDKLAPSDGIWASVHDTITSLRQLGATLRRAGVRHRQQRVARFAGLDRNREQYEMFERLAYQKAAHIFPNASTALQKRIAESIAIRRCRFLYLERHQMKARVSTDMLATDSSNNPLSSEAMLQKSTTGNDLQEPKNYIPSIRKKSAPTLNLQTELSKTVATELDPQPYAESVASVQVTMGTFPPLPTINESTMSFTCQYCSLVCPATESINETAWKNHLIHDLEPFFCIFESCKDPFGHGDSFSSLLTHIRTAHSQRRWYCWYCQSAATKTGLFSSSSDLEDHLMNSHGENSNKTLWSTIINHSVVRTEPLSTECPFCGGYPEELEKVYPDRECKAAVEGLTKHIKVHLVTISLFLLPINMAAVETAEVDDLATGIDTGIGTIQDIGGLQALDGLTTVTELQCSNDDCDCRINNSIPSGDWVSFSETIQLSGSPVLPAHKDWTISESNTNGWEFWQQILGSSPQSGLQFPDMEDDAKLKEYFGIAPVQTQKNKQDINSSVADDLQILQSLQDTGSDLEIASDWNRREHYHSTSDASSNIEKHEKFQNWVEGNCRVLAITSQQSRIVTTDEIIPIDALAGLSVCYYSFAYAGQESMMGALRSILRQLLNQQRSLLQYAAEICLKSPGIWSSSFETLSAIFEMAIHHPDFQHTRVIFDNINRCSDNGLLNKWLYSNLEDSFTKSSRVKYLFTCWNSDYFLYTCRHTLSFPALTTIDVYADAAKKSIIIPPDNNSLSLSPEAVGTQILSNDEDKSHDEDEVTGILFNRVSVIEGFEPDIAGFQKHILKLNPSLEGHGSYLINRLAFHQLIRYKRFLAIIVEHLRVGSNCPSGPLCIAKGSLGLPFYSVSMDQKGNEKTNNPSDLESDADEYGASPEGLIIQESFPAGIPMPPTQTLPAEFECPHCFSPKKVQKPSDWTRHVHEDVEPFTCTWPGCREPRTFKRKADWARHENEGHRQLEWWGCDVDACRHICYRRDNFLQHLVREHKLKEPPVKSKAAMKKAGHTDATWEKVEQCHIKTSKQPQNEPCRFCGRSFTTWKSLLAHLARHMEQIALPVLLLVAAKSKELTADTIIDPVQGFPP